MKYAMKLLTEARDDEERYIGQELAYVQWAKDRGDEDGVERTNARIKERTERVEDLTDAIEKLEDGA